MRTSNIYLTAGFAFVLSVALAVSVFTSTTMLVFESDNEIQYAHSVYSIDEFEINYVHSYEGTEIEQEYEINDGRIIQREERFRYHASGIDPTANTTRDGDWFVIEPDREFESFSFRVSYSTRQVVILNGEEIATDEFADSGQRVEIKIKELNAIERLFYTI